jgi:hypothetical protein
MLQLSLSVKMFTILGEIPTSSMTNDDLDGAFVLAKRAFVLAKPAFVFVMRAFVFVSRAFVRPQPSIRSRRASVRLSSRERSFSSRERSFDLNRAFVFVTGAFVFVSRAFVFVTRALVFVTRAFGDVIERDVEPRRTDECQPFGLDYRLARIGLTHVSSYAYIDLQRSVPMPLRERRRPGD